MSYGTSAYDAWRQFENYVGLTIPESLLLRADKVIE